MECLRSWVAMAKQVIWSSLPQEELLNNFPEGHLGNFFHKHIFLPA